MEAKINIAEILKDKPKGTKLYADAFGELSLDGVGSNKDEIIFTKTKVNTSCYFYNDGKYSKHGEPILVPSKEMRDWSKFSWKKGDVLVSNDGGTEVIFYNWYDDTYTNFYGKHRLDSENKNNIKYNDAFLCTTGRYSLEDKDAAETYINAIEEKLGGKLNLKDGDVVVTDADPSLCYSKCIFILKEDFYTSDTYAKSYIFYNVNNNKVYFDEINTLTREPNIRLATEEEKKELFEALAKKGKTWDAEKKAIVDLKPKCELKPFDRCIWKIRNCEGSIWQASFVSYVDEYGATPMGMSIDEDLVNLIILPYNDQTKLLVGTTDEWEGGEQ